METFLVDGIDTFVDGVETFIDVVKALIDVVKSFVDVQSDTLRAVSAVVKSDAALVTVYRYFRNQVCAAGNIVKIFVVEFSDLCVVDLFDLLVLSPFEK